MRYGYARVSARDQDTEIQIQELLAAGVAPENIFQEKKSGRTVEGRDALTQVLEKLQPGDDLVVSRYDRLARSIYDLSRIIRDFHARDITLLAVHNHIDMSSATGRAMVSIFGVIGELDYEMRRERQAAGIARAKQDGVYAKRAPGAGRKRSIASDQTDELVATVRQFGVATAAEKFSVDRSTIFRALKRVEDLTTSDQIL